MAGWMPRLLPLRTSMFACWACECTGVWNMADQGNKEAQGTCAGASRAANEFADTTTIHGPAHIKAATNTLGKLFWLCVFLTCCGFGLSQLFSIVNEFIQRPVSTKVDIDSRAGAFPSVTLCNINPIRKSQVYRNPALEAFMEEIPANTVRGNGTSTFLGPIGETTQRFLERINQNGSYDYDPELIFRDQFAEVMGNSSLANRQEMGHQLNRMMLKCTYNGYICTADTFAHSFSKYYGNCYTFNSVWKQIAPNAVAVGPNNGLRLVLYKEGIEYLDKITHSGGWRLAIQPFGTLSLPFITGLSLTPGLETFVSIYYSSTVRLGEPYGVCDEGVQFATLYNGLNYTGQACQATCKSRRTLVNCNCYLPETIETFPRDVVDNYQPCDHQGRNCSENDKWLLELGYESCDCTPACRETLITTAVSTNTYPNQEQYARLVSQVCESVEYQSHCDYLERFVNGSAEVEDYPARENFAAVNVYFSSLLRSHMTELPSYTASRLLADIGGTLGLCLGFSIVSSAEIARFLWSLICALFMRGNHQPNREERHVTT